MDGSYGGLSETEVRAAVAGAGTNAAPYLIKWIQHEESSLRGEIAAKLVHFMSANRARQFTVSAAQYRASGATLALSSLCTNLGPDELAQVALILTKTNSPQTAFWVIYVLSCQGSSQAKQLALALHQPDSSVKLLVLQFLRAMHSRGVHPDQYEPVLTDLLSDPDVGIRIAATNALTRIAPDALTNAPGRASQSPSNGRMF
jgi:hypothetical protein